MPLYYTTDEATTLAEHVYHFILQYLSNHGKKEVPPSIIICNKLGAESIPSFFNSSYKTLAYPPGFDFTEFLVTLGIAKRSPDKFVVSHTVDMAELQRIAERGTGLNRKDTGYHLVIGRLAPKPGEKLELEFPVDKSAAPTR